MDQQIQYSTKRGGDLDLISLWKVLVEYRYLIIMFTAITTLGAAYYAWTLPTVYTAKVLMLSVNGSGNGGNISNRLGGLASSLTGISANVGSGSQGEQAFARLKTRVFLSNHIKEKNLKPLLFADQWSEQEKRWIDEEPADRVSAELLNSMIEAGLHPRSKAGMASLTLRWKSASNPDKIADMANDLVNNINYYEKQRAIVEADKSILFLKKELERTKVISFQSILHNMIEEQMRNIMMANIKDELIFTVIEPAVKPKRADKKPILIIILIGVMSGIFVGSFLAISVKFFKESSQKE